MIEKAGRCPPEKSLLMKLILTESKGFRHETGDMSGHSTLIATLYYKLLLNTLFCLIDFVMKESTKKYVLNSCSIFRTLLLSISTGIHVRMSANEIRFLASCALWNVHLYYCCHWSLLIICGPRASPSFFSLSSCYPFSDVLRHIGHVNYSAPRYVTVA